METTQNRYRYSNHSVFLAMRGWPLLSDKTSSVPEIENRPPGSMYLHEGPSQTHTTIAIEESHEQPIKLIIRQSFQRADFGRIFSFSGRCESEPGFDTITGIPVHDRDPDQSPGQLIASHRIRAIGAIHDGCVRIWSGDFSSKKFGHLPEMGFVLIGEHDHELPRRRDMAIGKEEAEPVPCFWNVIQKRFQRPYPTPSRGWRDSHSHLFGLLSYAAYSSIGKSFHDLIMARDGPHPPDDSFFHLRIG